jgi:hypothetical protein
MTAIHLVMTDDAQIIEDSRDQFEKLETAYGSSKKLK